MKASKTFRMICSIGCVLVSLVMINEAYADGDEQLGLPSIPIAVGSEILVEGVGLDVSQPGVISMEIPADGVITQALLYWTGRYGDDDTAEVNGMEVTGTLIGIADTDANTYRVDITELSETEGWLVPGQTNDLSVGGLEFSRHENGAALVVILDDGSTVDLQILDGNDFAFLPFGEQTVPVPIAITPATEPRTATMYMVVSDIVVPRPAAVEVVIDGVTNLSPNVFLDNEGDFLDVVELDVTIPAGASNVTVRPLSVDDGSELVPASLYWHLVTWVLPEPPVDEGCTYTIGYWKNHWEDWPTNSLSIFSDVEAMEILWTPPKKGNAYYILAHQYIGAELNVVNGASIPESVLDDWLSAQELLLYYESEKSIPKKTDDRDLAIDLAGVLDDYNNGDIGPGHCDD